MNGTDKIFYEIGGLPLLAHTIQVFEQSSSANEIIVVTKEDMIEQVRQLCAQHGFVKVADVVAGGKTRTESVMKGLDHVCANTAYAAIHDGARPFVTTEIFEDTLEKAKKYHAAAPAIPVKDTIKTVSNHIVTGTPDRASLFAVQTPQIFDFDLLRGALTKAMKTHTPVTDDCSAVEAIGMSVYLTDGNDENIKITTPSDLLFAQAIWERRQSQCE